MLMRKLLIILLFVPMLLFSSCKGPDKIETYLGNVVNNTYENDFFGMKFQTPNDWKQVADMKSEIQKSIDEGQKIDIGSLESLDLYISFKDTSQNQNTFTPRFLCVADKVGFIKDIKNETQYLKHVEDTIKTANPEYKIVKEINKVNIAGKDFYAMETELKIKNFGFVTQKNYCVLHKGYFLNLIFSCQKGENPKEFENVLNTLEFY